MSLQNPNKKIGIYYDWLEADAFYYGWRFGYVPLPTFYQGHKNTTMVSPVFVGQSVIEIRNLDFVTNYGSEKASDRFYVDVWIFARIKFKIGSIKTRRYTMWIKCGLELPLVVNGASNGGFRATDCDVDF
ncbi:hypothetical protein QJS04_geneDACA008597 [Acorus gramineus]|uniref:Late embryogenesis abundant protein LEA-2 subgroup domain-containing protein n=1 Tax=Acorus gramineus TaxID=55184 RepID=A0AAV9AJ10_ACOGR|nr:hypothetical protein QJS04_geneDACA008597 [Acorus gramineus]